MFLAIDPVGFKPNQPMTFNRYSYANNNPYKYKDPDGRVIDTIWDAANVVYDVGGAIGAGAAWVKGAATGNEALMDAAGAGFVDHVTNLAVDGVAMAIPGLPAGITKIDNAVDLAKGVNIDPKTVLSGGRSGSNVKNLVGPPNSAVRGGGQRAFITNDKGEVVLDVTKNRVKPVTPGKGFGPKREPTREELDTLNKVLEDGS